MHRPRSQASKRPTNEKKSLSKARNIVNKQNNFLGRKDNCKQMQKQQIKRVTSALGSSSLQKQPGKPNVIQTFLMSKLARVDFQKYQQLSKQVHKERKLMQIIERNHEDTAYCLHLRDCLVHVRKCQKNILASSSAVEEEGASETKDNKIVSKVEQHFIEICNIVEQDDASRLMRVPNMGLEREERIMQMKEHIIKHITEQKVILSSVFTQVERLSKHLPVSQGFMDTIKGIDEMLAETIISKERNRELQKQIFVCKEENKTVVERCRNIELEYCRIEQQFQYIAKEKLQLETFVTYLEANLKQAETDKHLFIRYTITKLQTILRGIIQLQVERENIKQKIMDYSQQWNILFHKHTDDFLSCFTRNQSNILPIERKIDFNVVNIKLLYPRQKVDADAQTEVKTYSTGNFQYHQIIKVLPADRSHNVNVDVQTEVNLQSKKSLSVSTNSTQTNPISLSIIPLTIQHDIYTNSVSLSCCRCIQMTIFASHILQQTQVDEIVRLRIASKVVDIYLLQEPRVESSLLCHRAEREECFGSHSDQSRFINGNNSGDQSWSIDQLDNSLQISKFIESEVSCIATEVMCLKGEVLDCRAEIERLKKRLKQFESPKEQIFEFVL